MAEWLGRGLQNLLRWFESTRDLLSHQKSKVLPIAWVAELVDALVSNTNGSNTVPVRPRPQVHISSAGSASLPHTKKALRLHKLMALASLLAWPMSCLILAPSLSASQTHIPAFDSTAAYHFIQKQISLGPRVPNTPAHQLCSNYLQQQLTAMGAEVQVQPFRAKAFDGQTLELKNIIASFQPDCARRILLAAHWDTRPVADKDKTNSTQPIEGANDGASGVGVLLAIAQTLGQCPVEALGVDIILFDGEDYGPPHGSSYEKKNSTHWCLGAQYWSQYPHLTGYRAVYGILLDMVGTRDATFYQERYSMHYAAHVVKRIWQTAEQLGHEQYFIAQNSHGHIIDDHVFVNRQAQIPMVNILDHYPGKGQVFKPYHHTHKDNLRLIDPKTLQAVGETLLHVIYTE